MLFCLLLKVGTKIAYIRGVASCKISEKYKKMPLKGHKFYRRCKVV